MKFLIINAKYEYDEVNKVTYYGRLENGKKYSVTIHTPQPYFYVQSFDSQIDAYAIDNTPLKKIVVDNPLQVTKERENYQQVWEADIPYVERVGYDLNIKRYVELSDFTDTTGNFLPRMCKLDIEVDPSHGFPLPEYAKEEVFSITFYDTYLKKYFILTTKTPQTLKLLEKIGHANFQVRDFDNERDMLYSFYSYLTNDNSSPDVLSGYNITGFDYPYLKNRMKKFNLLIDDKQYVVFDDEYAYIRLRENDLESYSLDYVAQTELGERKIQHKMDLKQLRDSDIEQFLYYNYVDVKLIVQLDEKLGLFQSFFNLSLIAGNLDMTRYNASYIIDSFLLHYGHDKFVLPTRLDKSLKKEEKGAIVLSPQYGMYENVVVFDFKSMYPSLIIQFNLSPDTLDPNGEININGVRFTKKKDGYIPTIIKGLLKARYETKEVMKHTTDKEEYVGLNYRQRMLKELTNAFYGVFGNVHYRLYNPDIQGAITYVARQLLNFVQDYLQSREYKVLYGDTDSVFFQKHEGESIEDMEILVNDVNQQLDKFTKRFGVEKNQTIHLEFESLFDKWFQPGVKKKYYGRYVYKDGETIDSSKNEMKIRGFEARRSNTSFYTKRKQLELMLVSLKGTKIVNKWVKNEEEKWRQHSINLEDIAISSAVKKDLDYKTNNQVLKAVENARNQGIDIDLGLGKVKIYFLKDPQMHEIAVGFDSSLPDKYVKMLDWEEHKRRCFDAPMEAIISYFKPKPLDSWIVTQ